jgi:hypothetical protein
MAKLDPRTDPLSHPPAKNDDFSVDRVRLSKSTSTPKIAVKDEPELPAAPSALTGESVPRAKSSAVTSVDPRHEIVEKLLDANDWRGLSKELGPLEEVGKLPPNLGILAALAHNETIPAGHPDAVATVLRCMAAILDVSEDSPIARILARRILRKNPVRLRDRKAPPARVSLLIVGITLAVGGGVGWLVSIGSWRGVVNLFR